MSDRWEPHQYLKYRRERTRPSSDLAARIDLADPRDILDVGCGPGNSTEVLRRRWPSARVVGVDNSEEMIQEARRSYPQGVWVRAEAAALEEDARYDVVFSNAVLQWVPDHRRLVPRLLGSVKPGGVLAVQVPANRRSPLHRALLSTARAAKWRSFTAGCESLLEYHEPRFYYNLLCPLCRGVDIWETTYFHELAGHRDLIEWYRGTGMKPYLQRLPDGEAQTEFMQEVLERCRASYPAQVNGAVLYPFRRLFFVASPGGGG